MSSTDRALPTPPAAVAVPSGVLHRWPLGLAAAGAWLAVGFVTLAWPNRQSGFSDWAYTREFGWLSLAFGAVIGAVALGRRLPAQSGPRRAGPWLLALAGVTAAWQILTAKLAWLPAPFFAPPQSLIEVYVEDWRRLGDSLRNSLLLLAGGYAVGAIAGFLTGVAIGWSRVIGYWVHPVLRFLGPVPSTALLPITFFFFPSSWSAGVFLIALATWFPVTVLTWSGIASVNRNYYDVARTMGAGQWFLVRHVAVPAALPQVFVGLFMGLGAAFSTLVVAEMMGVKSGLGWYLTWAQGWAAYSNMYAALILMAAVFSGIITLLFAVRDRTLSWQKGTLKW